MNSYTLFEGQMTLSRHFALFENENVIIVIQ